MHFTNTTFNEFYLLWSNDHLKLIRCPFLNIVPSNSPSSKFQTFQSFFHSEQMWLEPKTTVLMRRFLQVLKDALQARVCSSHVLQTCHFGTSLSPPRYQNPTKDQQQVLVYSSDSVMHIHICLYSFPNSFAFGCTTRLAGSQFPHKQLNSTESPEA